MANVKKEDRADGTEIRKLNLLGLGLKKIGSILKCDPATVSLRLKDMGIKPTDTRRNFMEDIYEALDTEEKELLADMLYSLDTPIKPYILGLIKEKLKTATRVPEPIITPLPPMQPVTDLNIPPLGVAQQVLEETLEKIIANSTAVMRTFVGDNGEVQMEDVTEHAVLESPGIRGPFDF
jgi:hypothetical protein